MSGTFFLQLTDSTPPDFELGQVGSFGRTKRRHSVDLKNRISVIQVTIRSIGDGFVTHLCMGVPDL